MDVRRYMGRGLAWLVLSANCSLAVGEWTTLVDKGPSSNRVDIVMLGDGYTQSDLAAGQYEQHVYSFLDHLFANAQNSEPFHRYHNFFNVHAIEVVSNESGADIPPSGIYRDTALDAQYFGDGVTERLLTVHPNKTNAVRDAALAGAPFTAEMQYVTVNDSKYGGSGGSYAVFAGGNSSSSEIALHEIGHSFSNLADEYDYGLSPSHYDAAEPDQPNVTTDPTGAKWSHWLNYNQPGVGIIGAYEGAKYHKTGIYRPSLDSKMRSLNRPFNAVSREQIVLDIYDLVDPLDDWTDNTSPLFDPHELAVTPVDSGVIQLEWFVDDVLIAGANQPTFDLSEFGFVAGDYEVTLRAFDPMGFDPVDGWVRMNQSMLEQYISWQVTLSDATLVPGDFDGNQLVDSNDYSLWRSMFGASVKPYSAADGNGDGIVNLADYNVWRNNRGLVGNTSSSSASSVPEPSGLRMSIVVALLLFACSVQQNRCAIEPC